MRKTLLLLVSALFAGCQPTTTAEKTVDNTVSKETEMKMGEAHRQVGLPLIKNWREKRLAKEIYEKRDSVNLVTYTYIVDLSGKFHFLGETVGYGLPYATQYSSPQKLITHEGFGQGGSDYGVTLPQSEPNGLFMPTESSATWVMMKTDRGLEPQYIEPTIVVFTFKLPDNHPQVASNKPLYTD